METIELENEDVDVLRRYIDAKEEVNKLIEKYFRK